MRAHVLSANPTSFLSRPRGAALHHSNDWSVFAAVAILFLVSGGMLWYTGYNYDGLAGSAATKIHPFTYLICGVAGWRALASGDPASFTARASERNPACVFMIFAALLVLAAATARGGAGLAGMIDTFVSPAILTILLARSNEHTIDRLETLLHAAMAANALLGLFEFATKILVFPYRFEGATFMTDLRSTAFQGHPLVNAMVTSAYVLALIGGARRVPAKIKACLVALQCAALVIFGGRTAMVVTLVIVCVHLTIRSALSLRAGRVSLVAASAALAIAPVLTVGATAIVSSGSLDAILIRFSSDGGSANARVEMMELFNHFSLMEIVIGPDQAHLETLRRINGLEWGIENPIVRMTLYNGGFLTFILTIAVIAFMRELVRGRERGVWLPMLALTLILNTAESIASKTTILAKFVVIFTCLYRDARRRQAPITTAPALAPRPR